MLVLMLICQYFRDTKLIDEDNEADKRRIAQQGKHLIKRKTSLPYFRVKLSCVCLMFAYRKKVMTYSDPMVPYSHPKMTYSYPKGDLI